MELPPPTPNSSSKRVLRSPYRRRRIVWSLLLFTAVGFYFLAPSSFWERGSSLAMADESHIVAEKLSIAEDIPLDTSLQPKPSPDEELKNLLHMVATSELRIPKNVDPSKPLSKDVYIVDIGGSWLKEADADPPVIVFSKTYCPYSKAAKALLQSYDLSPPPKIVEVDLREDSNSLKVILQRLTNHGTFPNIFIAGQSIGGSDDLKELHKNNELALLLENAGVSVLGNKQDNPE